MWWRKLGVGASLVATSVALSGCVVFLTPPTAKQKKRSVVIKVKACASQSGGTPTGSCTNEGNSHNNARSDYSQLFLGFRVPKGATAPTSFSATTGPTSGGPTLHFHASKSYARELQRLDQAPHKQKWVGYTSRYFLYSS